MTKTTTHRTRSVKHGFFNSAPGALSPQGKGPEHQVILQALNRYLTYGTKDNPVKIFYNAEAFTDTEPEWDVTKVIFVEDGTHPDMRLFSKNPAEALKQVGGREAGSLRNTEVTSAPGQPRMSSFINFSDKEVAALYEAGDLGVSTAFYCSVENGELAGKVTPNHILLFRPDRETQPRDSGSMFLNTDHDDTQEKTGMAKELDKILSEFTNSVKSLFKGEQDPEEDPTMDDTTEQRLALANTAIQSKDAEIKKLKEEKKTAEEELANSQKELETFRQQESDKKWTELKNTTIPPGLFKTEEQEKELRELYNTDRDGFYQKVMKVNTKAPPNGNPAGKKGDQHYNSDQGEKAERMAAANAAWNQATGVVTKKN